MITLGIADDHSLILNGLEFMLQDQQVCEVLFMAADGMTLMNYLKDCVPDVLLLDIELPDANGQELCKEILKKYPSVRIIVLTNHDELSWIRKMMRSGASGYLLKGTSRTALLQAINAVFEGKQYIDREMEKMILNQSLSGRKDFSEVRLTAREKEILALVAAEFSNKEIAEKLYVSIRTVESHRNSLNLKLNVKNTAGLVNEAVKRGLI